MPAGQLSVVELRKWHGREGPQNACVGENEAKVINDGYETHAGRAIKRIVNGIFSTIDVGSHTSRISPSRVPGGHAPVAAFGLRHGSAFLPHNASPAGLIKKLGRSVISQYGCTRMILLAAQRGGAHTVRIGP